MAAEKKKLICVIGATGNQGGSVARRFLAAGFRVRGITRNPDSPAAQKLAALGVELVKADLEDVPSLERAFVGANVIFSVTNFWEAFFSIPGRIKAIQDGITWREFGYNAEYRQGKNICDAAITVADSLDENGFIASTLSFANDCSRGDFTELFHFDAKAEIFPNYVRRVHPRLAAKLSCIQTGYFYSSFKILPKQYFGKLPDGSVEMTFPTDPNTKIPHFAPVEDMGTFVYAVYQMPPGKSYMAAGTTCTWPEFLKTWSDVTGIPAKYRQITGEEMVKAVGEPEFGGEVADMFMYSSNPGYDGGAFGEKLLTAEDIRKAGISCPLVTWERWARGQNWEAILAILHGPGRY